MQTIAAKKAADTTAVVKSRVLLVDDHPLIRLGLKRLVDLEADLVVCAEAGTESEALLALAETCPHIVIMDVALGATNGIDLTRTIHGLLPGLPVLMLSLYGESIYVQNALAAGACGYVKKTDEPETILAAIRLALGGKACVSQP